MSGSSTSALESREEPTASARAATTVGPGSAISPIADRRALRGPARIAMDFYEAAEVLGRCWHELTGRYLPAIDQVPKRRTTRPIDEDSVTESTYTRRREVLRAQLLDHGLWPGRLHAIVEGDADCDWIYGLVETLLGWLRFEEANFSDDELVEVARRLAADPPGDRPAVAVRLTGPEVRAEHERRIANARRGQEPGLAGTLLKLLRHPRHGPVNLTKLELATGLLALAREELRNTKPIDVALERRPAVRFVYDRVAQRLVDAGWR